MTDPGNDRARPTQGSGLEKVAHQQTQFSIAPAYNVAVRLRHRRVASFRCPVLADGRRDTLAKKVPAKKITVRAIGTNTIELVGCDRAVAAVITTLGVRYQRAPRVAAWLVPQNAAEDVLALLEVRGYQLEARL